MESTEAQSCGPHEDVHCTPKSWNKVNTLTMQIDGRGLARPAGQADPMSLQAARPWQMYGECGVSESA